jgi:hypothetical protein
MLKFDDLLSSIQNTNEDAYVFLDSNVDLLKLRQQNAANYLNLVISKSFLQGIVKASRIFNESKSLIDHILFNKNCNKFVSGTIVSDVSDHFFTFIVPPDRPRIASSPHKFINASNYSQTNLNNFKQDLAESDWTNVISCHEVDAAYGEFWNIYTESHNRNFPLSRKIVTSIGGIHL